MTLAPEEVKACCADVYASAAARFLLGDSFHPGGATLTYRLAAALRVGPGAVVCDVACGPGWPTPRSATLRGSRTSRGRRRGVGAGAALRAAGGTLYARRLDPLPPP